MHDSMMKKAMMSEPEKMAKMSTLNNIKKTMSSAMMDKLKGLKKVSIMSDSPEGLQEGLHAAQKIVEGSPEEEQQESPEEEAQEPSSDEEQMADIMEKDSRGLSPEHAGEEEHLSEEDIDQEIAELQAMKEKLKQRKTVNAYNHSEESK